MPKLWEKIVDKRAPCVSPELYALYLGGLSRDHEIGLVKFGFHGFKAVYRDGTTVAGGMYDPLNRSAAILTAKKAIAEAHEKAMREQPKTIDVESARTYSEALKALGLYCAEGLPYYDHQVGAKIFIEDYAKELLPIIKILAGE